MNSNQYALILCLTKSMMATLATMIQAPTVIGSIGIVLTVVIDGQRINPEKMLSNQAE